MEDIGKSGPPMGAQDADHRAEIRAARNLEFSRARARQDWPEIVRLAEKLIAEGSTPSPNRLFSLAHAYRKLNDPNNAERVATRAIEADPGRAPAFAILAWAAAERGDGTKALGLYRRAAKLDPDNPRWPLDAWIILNYSGRLAEARREMEALQRRWPDHPLVLRNFSGPPNEDGELAERADGEADARSDMALAPRDEELRRAPMVEDRDRDVIIAEGPGAVAVALVFAGSNDRALKMPLSVFDRYLAALGVNAIYFKDFSRLLFFGGVQSLGRYEASLEAMRAMLGRMGLSRRFAIGLSAGGPAAVAYGVELGVDRAVSFAGPTHAHPNPSARAIHNVIAKRLRDLVPKERHDLKQFLASRQVRTKIDLLYGAQMARDRDFAEYVAGSPMVTLRPQAGLASHELLSFMAKNGDLSKVLGELLV